MKYYIPIEWETRNLAVESFQLNIPGNSCDINEINRERDLLIEKHERIFVQARIGKNNYKLVSELEQCGFGFAECTVDPYSRLNKNYVLEKFIKNASRYVPRKYKCEDLKCELMNKKNGDIVNAVLSIAENSFMADRFHMDWHCDNARADARYSNWIKDVITKNEVNIFLLKYKNRIIAFFVQDNENLVLAGFERKYANSGLGDFLWLSVCANILEQNITNVTTRISIANIPVLNLYARIGFKFRNPTVVLHYWSWFNDAVS